MPAFFCTALNRPSPRAAAPPPPRPGGWGHRPSRLAISFTLSGLNKGDSKRIQAGRLTVGQLHCETSRVVRDAALKGPLRRPPAALDRRSSQRSPCAPYGTSGIGATVTRSQPNTGKSAAHWWAISYAMAFPTPTEFDRFLPRLTGQGPGLFGPSNRRIDK
jgi:hypothetical protein